MEEKYAFLLVNYEMPEFIHKIQNDIPENELCTDDGCGLELESHVTLVPCLENNVKILPELKKLCGPIDKYKIFLTGISIFENPEYDVLKCDAHCEELNSTNNKIRDKFPSYSEFKEYHPHMTIAYFKKGYAKKYEKLILPKINIMKPIDFSFSYYDENGNNKQINWI